ncbi:hypothetical protein [Geobacter sp. AOG1]|uniref:hypothetical protein n=1 Tax=Geobacter sp. AOG1 TaxID=1566346 RepID=UPI001CC7E6B3|nr:hypothetical protein [Geobacter sp. AOG1]GFE58022.1 hypothetical protein AOG1_19020 [Geobacter sp. AOG1]
MYKMLALMVLLSTVATPASAEMLFYSRTSDFVAQYDASTIEATRHGDLKVLVKKVYSEKGEEALFRELGISGVSNIVQTYLLDCAEGSYSVEQTTAFDSNGNKIFTEKSSQLKRKIALQGSPEDALTKAVCKK